MASLYPSGLDALTTTHQDSVGEIIHATDVNNIADAVNKIEAELGTLPKGQFSSVSAKLGALFYGPVTTIARDAIAQGNRPTGLIVFNTTTNRYEFNAGSQVTPNWQPVGPAGPWSTSDITDGAITSAKIADGTIIDADISTGAGVGISKLSGYPSDSTKFLRGDGTWNAPATPTPPVVVLRKVTPKTVANTTVATDLLNAEITLPALTATNIVRITACGDALNNTGSNQNFPALALYLGGTQLIATGFLPGVMGTNGQRMPWRFTITIANQNSTASQFTFGDYVGTFGNPTSFGTAVTDVPLGYGYAATPLGGINPFWHYVAGSSTVTTTSSLSLAMPASNGIASASYDTTLRSALIEIF